MSRTCLDTGMSTQSNRITASAFSLHLVTIIKVEAARNVRRYEWK